MNIEFNYKSADEESRKKIIEEITNKYKYLNHGILSKSLCNRDIDYIQIGNTEKMVLFAGAFHGMEWLTSLLLLHFIKKVCVSINEKRPISDIHILPFLKKRGLILIPCVNPDGVEISLYGARKAGVYQNLVESTGTDNIKKWQANARGVDINHNFDAKWKELNKLEKQSGIIGPARTRYGGKFAESEPETKAITNLCRKNKIDHAIAFHSQGEEIYWNFGMNTPEKSELMAQIMALSSGYIASEPEGLAVGGGFKDWFIEEFKKPAFTIEIGKGENPLPLNDLEDIYNKLEECLILSLVM